MAATRNRQSADRVGQAIATQLSQRLKSCHSFLVAYSGGLDSTVLLHAANSYVKGSDSRLSAVHVHHGLSPNADRWAEFCGQVCADLGVPLEIIKVTVARNTGRGIEDEARRRRFEAIDSLSADWVLLGHHANDQAETLLHHLLRGTGVRGAAGIPPSKGRILRPFLRLPRAVLESYAGIHGLTWIEDESNGDCRYTRNYLRAEILPLAGKRFPRAIEQLSAAAERFGEAAGLLDELAELDLQGHEAKFPIAVSALACLSDRRAGNLFRYLLQRAGQQAPAEARLAEFMRQLRDAGPDRHPRLELPNYVLLRRKGSVVLEMRDQAY